VHFGVKLDMILRCFDDVFGGEKLTLLAVAFLQKNTASIDHKFLSFLALFKNRILSHTSVYSIMSTILEHYILHVDNVCLQILILK